MTQTPIGKITFDENFHTKTIKDIAKNYDFELYDKDKILISYIQNKPPYDYIIQISDFYFNSKTSQSFRTMKSERPYRVCILNSHIIFYYYEHHERYLMKYDSNLKELKRIRLNHDIISLTSNKDRIYSLTNASSCNVHVFNDKLNIVQTLGQIENPYLTFYFPIEIKKILNGDNKFYCLYSNRVVIVDQITGKRLKVIPTKSKLIKMDSNESFFLLDRERSMISIYDSDGELLDETPIINLPIKIDFLSDEYSVKFISNDNDISDWYFFD